MGSMRPGGRFLPFSKNIQRTQKQPVPPAFAASLSGSETDVSTSTEHLSREERYVIRHTPRREPQGQETASARTDTNAHKTQDSVSASGGSNRNSLKESVCGGNSNRSSLDVSTSSYNTLIIHGAGDELWTNRLSGIRDAEPHAPTPSPYHTLKREPVEKKSGIPVPVVSRGAGYIDIGGQRIYTSPPDQGVQEITEIPDDFLDQSSVLKHLAREAAASPPPPSPRADEDEHSLSRSQPDLSTVGRDGSAEGGSRWSGGEGAEDEAFAAMLDELAAENHALKQQLAEACTKIAKTDKLGQEVEAVRSAHEELVRSCERRERLERAARARLQADCRRVQDANRALRDQLHLLAGGADANRDSLLAQLLSQNKELAARAERQEVEMSAQRATLQEQRTHIGVLDTALTSAGANVVRLEEEVASYAERVAALQRALHSLQQVSERREGTERALRAQLESELGALRGRGCACGGGEADLRRALRERDERALQLEGECAKWEQRYLDEAALRQAAVSAAHAPGAVMRDARIAALEKSSAESERLMAEARSEKMRHMDEVHAAQKRVADLEGRVQELESRLAERDAMIKVLHAHAQYDSSASLRNNSSREELVGFGASSSTASFSSAETVGARYRHLRPYNNNNASNTNAGYESSSLRLEEQLAALDARLGDSRAPAATRTLCCFPSLARGGSRARGRLRGAGEEMLLLEAAGRSSQQTRSSSLPPPPSALPRPPRAPPAKYDRLDRRKDSAGSTSLASSRGSPLPYERASRSPRPPPAPRTPPPPSPPSSSQGGSLPSPSRLAMYAAARRRSTDLNRTSDLRTPEKDDRNKYLNRSDLRTPEKDDRSKYHRNVDVKDERNKYRIQF